MKFRGKINMYFCPLKFMVLSPSTSNHRFAVILDRKMRKVPNFEGR